MGTITNPRAIYGLLATGTHTKTNVRNDVEIGVAQTTLNLTGATKDYCVSATLATAGDTLTIDTETGIATIGTTPVAQVETATAAGTIGTTGNATVTVTGARITGSPLAVSVAVTSGDTASVWAGKVRTALNATAAITSVYTVGGSTTSIVLTETDPENNDTTLNVALANGTCTGITAAPSSTNTTAGVGGVKLTNNTGDGKDFEGVSLGSMPDLHAILLKCETGSSTFDFNSGALSSDQLDEGAFCLFAATTGVGTGSLVITAAGGVKTTINATFIQDA
jgi:hypothetical protein